MRALWGGALALALMASTAEAARLDYRGPASSRRAVESLLGPALRSPRDSVALVAGLGRLVAGLEAAGYLDARATAEWDTTGNEPRLQVSARVGRRYRIATLVIDAGAPAESAQFGRALGLAVGDWASPPALAEAVRRSLRAAAAAAHPYAELTVTQFDWDSAGARVRLGGSLGPEVTVGAVRFEGMRVTRPAFAERALGPLAGRPFDPTAAEAGRERLLRLELFRSVAYQGLEGQADWSRAALVYRVEEPAYNRFEGAVGVQGARRAAGLARLDLGNLGGTGRAAGVSWQSRAASAEAFSARYVEPLLFGTPLRAEATLEQQREDSLFTRARWGARFSFLLTGRERLEAGYEQDQVLDRAAGVREADLQSTVFALERDGRDAPAVPRRGARIRIGATQSFKRESLRPTGTRKSTSSAADAVVEWHRPLARQAGVAWTLSGAGRFGSERVLGVYERYPLGGATTLRGFDEQARRVDRYGLSRFEWRWFVGGGTQHLALFWDHAWTFTRLAQEAGERVEEKHFDGVGVGLRVNSPAGLVGVDYGFEPGRPPAEGKLHLQLVTQF